MNWAWRQALTPMLKLVMMVLADAADDHRVCWPSVSTLAQRCSVSTRIVQRSLRVMINRGSVIAEPRQRRDGSSTSNCGRPLLAGGDNLSPPREAGDIRPGHGCQDGPDVPVTPGTTNRIVIDPPQPAAGDEQRIDSAAVASASGCGHQLKLAYPKGCRLRNALMRKAWVDFYARPTEHAQRTDFLDTTRIRVLITRKSYSGSPPW